MALHHVEYWPLIFQPKIVLRYLNIKSPGHHHGSHGSHHKHHKKSHGHKGKKGHHAKKGHKKHHKGNYAKHHKKVRIYKIIDFS